MCTKDTLVNINSQLIIISVNVVNITNTEVGLQSSGSNMILVMSRLVVCTSKNNVLLHAIRFEYLFSYWVYIIIIIPIMQIIIYILGPFLNESKLFCVIKYVFVDGFC